FILEADRPEWSFLKDEMLWQTQPVTQGVVAGQSGFGQLFNPLGSGRLATVLGFVASKTAAGPCTTALTTTVRGATGGGFVIPTDTRWSGAPPAVGFLARDPLSLSFGTSVAFGTDVPLLTYQIAGTPTIITLPTPVVLAPGAGFVVVDGTVAEAINVAFFGRSRQARPEELAL